jgi:hypothetical protein
MSNPCQASWLPGSVIAQLDCTLAYPADGTVAPHDPVIDVAQLPSLVGAEHFCFVSSPIIRVDEPSEERRIGQKLTRGVTGQLCDFVVEIAERIGEQPIGEPDRFGLTDVEDYGHRLDQRPQS